MRRTGSTETFSMPTASGMAERSDRHDLAIGLLEKARQHRPNDPRGCCGHWDGPTVWSPELTRS